MTLLSICPAPNCELAMYRDDIGDGYHCPEHGPPPPDAPLTVRSSDDE